MSPQAPSELEMRFRTYMAAWNAHDVEGYSKFYAEDIYLHLPGCPPVQGKENAKQLMRGALAFINETLHPTFLLFGEKALAMEARAHSEALQDITWPFAFDGKTYSKGDKFSYGLIVHYEFTDDLRIKSYRAFSEVMYPDAGAGTLKEVIEGFDPIPDVN